MEGKARGQQEVTRSAQAAPALRGVRGQLAAKISTQPDIQLNIPVASQDSSISSLAFRSVMVSGIEFIREQQLSSHQRALRVLSLLKELVRREAGIGDFEESLRGFFQKLGQSHSVSALLIDLYRRTRAALYFSSRRKASLGFESERVADELSYLADWYFRRKDTIAAWQREGGDADPFSSIDARLFNLELFQDCFFSGSEGVEIAGSLCLSGFAQQQLWIKVFVRNQGGFVPCREGWLTWSDGAEDLFFAAPGDVRPVAALLPVRPDSVRMLIDNFRVFLPLRALDLPTGKHQPVFFVQLCDQNGCELSAGSLAAHISMPPCSEQPRLPSCQALGVWLEDFVRGNRISELRLLRGFRGVLDRGSEVLSVNFDLEIHGRAGEKLEAQCRFLDSSGYLVEGCAAVLRDSNRAFVSQLPLYPATPICSYFGLEMQIPLSCLKLDEAMNDLFCEVSVVSSSGEVLCGALQSFDAGVADSRTCNDRDRKLLGKPFISDPCAEIELAEFVVDPAWHFDGHDTIRLKAVLTSEKWAANPGRAVFSLETADGAKLLSSSVTDRWGRPAEIVQCLCLGGYEAPARQELVVNFDPDELPADVFGRGSAEAVLIGRLRVYSLDDRLQIETEQEFDYRSSAIAERLDAEKSGQAPICCEVPAECSAVPRRHNSLEHDAFVADILSRAYPVAGEVKFEIALNVNYLSHASEEFLLYYEILDRSGAVLGKPSSNGNSNGHLTGCMKRVNISQLIKSSLHSSGWFQIPVVLDLNLESIAAERHPLSLKDLHKVRVMLFSENGTLLQVASGGSSMLSGLDVYVEGSLSNGKRPHEQEGGAFLERIMPTIFGSRSSRQ